MFLKRHILLSLLLLSLLIILTLTSSLLTSSSSYRPPSFSSHRAPKASRPNLRVPLGSNEYPNAIVNANANANKNQKSKYNPTSWLTLPFLSSTPSSWYPVPHSERFESVVRETVEPLQQHDGVEGVRVWERVYMRDGVFYIVRKGGGRGWWGREDDEVGGMEGMGENLKYVTPEQAKTILGEYVIPIHGTSFILWEEGGVKMDYYTWWAHLILGSMRVYASLSLIKGTKTPLDEPARFMVPHSPSPSPFSSQAHISLMRSTFPSSPIEGKEAWAAYKDTGRAYVWERLVLVVPPSSSSSPSPSPSSLTPGSITSPHGRPTTHASAALATSPPFPFWSPLQHRTLLNTLGYLPVLTPDGRLVVSSLPREMRREGGWVEDERRRGGSLDVSDLDDSGGSVDGDLNTGGRVELGKEGSGGGSTLLPLVVLFTPTEGEERLDKTSYDELRVELRRLEWIGVVRFKEVKVDGMGFGVGTGGGGVQEVMRVVGESAVLISTHNPSLTNQLWMPSTPRSSIIEIFAPGVYDEGYAVLGRNVGHEHYTMWNTTYTTNPTALLDADDALTRREDPKPKVEVKPKDKVDDKPKPNPKPNVKPKDNPNDRLDDKPKPRVDEKPKPDFKPKPKEPPNASNQADVKAPNQADIKASEPLKNSPSGGIEVPGKAVAQLVRWILTRMDEEEDVVYR